MFIGLHLSSLVFIGFHWCSLIFIGTLYDPGTLVRHEPLHRTQIGGTGRRPRSATVPARCGRVRMPVSCLVRFCNVSKGRPIPLLTDPARPRRSPCRKFAPLWAPKIVTKRPKTTKSSLTRVPRRFNSAKTTSERLPRLSKMAQEASNTVEDGSRGLQVGPRDSQNASTPAPDGQNH